MHLIYMHAFTNNVCQNVMRVNSSSIACEAALPENEPV